VNAVVLLVAGVSYVMLRGNYRTALPAESTRPPVLTELREGAEWTARHAIVRTLVMVGAIASVGYMIPFSYLVLYVDNVLGLDATGYGFLLSFSALGGLAGSWIAARLRRRIGYGWSIVAALLLGAVSFAVIGLTSNVVVVAIALAAYICHSVVWGVLASSVRQQLTPDVMMGRVGSMSRLLGLIGLGIGALLGGVSASTFGLRIPFLIAAGLFVVAAVLGVTVVGRVSKWEHSRAVTTDRL
jgi:predicted MFS family arabinose efflux permease